MVRNSLPYYGIKTVEIWAGEIIFLQRDRKNRKKLDGNVKFS